MMEPPFDPNDLGLLASRDLDGDTTDEERRRLADAMDASESLRADADAMRRVCELVRRWAATTPAEIDWDAHAALITTHCQASDDAQDRPELDHILKRWAQDDVAYNDEQFQAEVMRRVDADAPPARTQSGWSRFIRLAAPLAAAAALAFALIGAPWKHRYGQSQDVVSRIVSALPEETVPPVETAKAPTCIVRFARESADPSPVLAQPKDRRPTGISFTAFGVATIGVAAGVP